MPIVLWETLYCCVTLRCVRCNALGVNMSCPSGFYLVRQNRMQITLSNMPHLNLNSFTRNLSPCISFRLHLGSCCSQYMATLLIKLHALVQYVSTFFGFVHPWHRLPHSYSPFCECTADVTIIIVFYIECSYLGHGIYSIPGSPTWCPRAPGRPQGPSSSPTGLF